MRQSKLGYSVRESQQYVYFTANTTGTTTIYTCTADHPYILPRLGPPPHIGCVRVGLIHFWVSHQLFEEAFAFAYLKLDASSNLICLFWPSGWMSLEFLRRGALKHDVVPTQKCHFFHQRGAREILKTS